VIRRAFDVAVAASVLALTAPLLAAAAVAIKLTSRGPVLYRQPRAGLHGRRFEVVKLRTMVEGAEFIGAGMAVDAGDPRITRVGALLRRSSIDELPNLWNVLRGEMSVIGPRPTLPEQIEAYDARQRRRLDVKPGITGWAQVNGRAALPWSERIELDIHYVENRSLRLDATILWRTLAIVLGRGGAGGVYHPGGGGFDL
jgi:lipopolysaccharide/colanic/teichoic acid biosynthesis glycosyltransferase